MKTYAIIFSSFFFGYFSYAQTLNWSTCGYVSGSGGGSYLNIDGSGINVTATGFEYDLCCGGGNSLFTGINDGASNAIIHNYVFDFSEPVDIYFQIFQITKNGAGHEDYMLFSGSPTIIPHNAVVNGGNEVVPNWSAGWIEVSYHNITSFNIQHGRGLNANPGYILFYPVDITSVLLGLDTEEKSNFQLSQNVEQSVLSIAGHFEPNFEIMVYSLLGQKIQVNYTLSDNLEIYTNDLKSGPYIIIIKTGKFIFRQKFMLTRR